MTAFALTPPLLAKNYNMLRETEPFSLWNLPEPEDVVFKVGRTARLRGQYSRTRDGRHQIMISATVIRSLPWLTMTMAHEMIHLHQGETGMETKSQHNAAFLALADEVCNVHLFDKGMF